MEAKFTLKNDYLFQTLFSKKGNEELLKDFLTGILNKDIEKIEIQKDVTLEKLNINEKYGILDIKATLDDKEIVAIEMQMVDLNNMRERTLYYGSKIIASELRSGGEYTEIKPVILINILNFNLLEGEDYCTETVIVSKNNREYEVINKIKYFFIELPKFRKSNPDLSNKLEQWLAFIDYEKGEWIEMATKNNVKIKKAKEEMEYLTGEEATRRIAELREKYIRDEAAIKSLAMERGLKEGLEKGLKKGREKGLEEGRQEGIQQGIEQGIEQGTKEIAKKMKQEGIDIDTITRITGIEKEELEKL